MPWLGLRRYPFQDPKNILLTINMVSSFYVSLNTTAVRARTGLHDFLLRGKKTPVKNSEAYSLCHQVAS